MFDHLDGGGFDGGRTGEFGDPVSEPVHQFAGVDVRDDVAGLRD
jgi:hypothetical protein